jgi:hypothetical protein
MSIVGIFNSSPENIYFWNKGRADDYFPPQPFIEPELSEQGVPEEESPELGQLASEAERRME